MLIRIFILLCFISLDVSAIDNTLNNIKDKNCITLTRSFVIEVYPHSMEFSSTSIVVYDSKKKEMLHNTPGKFKFHFLRHSISDQDFLILSFMVEHRGFKKNNIIQNILPFKVPIELFPITNEELHAFPGGSIQFLRAEWNRTILRVQSHDRMLTLEFSDMPELFKDDIAARLVGSLKKPLYIYKINYVNDLGYKISVEDHLTMIPFQSVTIFYENPY